MRLDCPSFSALHDPLSRTALFQKKFSSGRQDNMPTAALQQYCPYLFLELLHCPTQYRLRNMQSFRGSAEMQLLRYRNKMTNIRLEMSHH
ncbi:hypothetical protein P1P91_13135 [Halomonas piscis]|uniref:Uncharacterized protein n=1 Tax=Halomonas piscis TaxID=3031727 RepID=A0ABY9YZ86_9GAMM|nr:hypothetical protein [Halomonas piscis]WNK19761.1 hypothetical protein P1P91_13135 [Halomonas piscis]